jgi:hypothetical protein
MIGIGIGLAQLAGVHRRKIYQTNPTLREELWKRAFWYYIFMSFVDRL